MIQPVSFGSEKVTGEAESLSAQKPLEEHCYRSMTIFMYLQSDVAKMGDAEQTQELNHLNLPLTSFPTGAVAAMHEGALSMVPGPLERGLGAVPGQGLQIPLSTAWALPVLWLLLRKMRPLHTLIPKAAGRELKAEEGGAQEKVAPQLQEVCVMSYVPICVGSGRGVT